MNNNNTMNNNNNKRQQHSSTLSVMIQTPQSHDILSVKDNSYRTHPGNIRYMELVRGHQETYRNASVRLAKTEITLQVRKLAKQDGGRFLEPSGKGYWVELSNRAEHEKVSHALRSKRSGKSKRGAPKKTKNQSGEKIVGSGNPRLSTTTTHVPSIITPPSFVGDDNKEITLLAPPPPPLIAQVTQEWGETEHEPRQQPNDVCVFQRQKEILRHSMGQTLAAAPNKANFEQQQQQPPPFKEDNSTRMDNDMELLPTTLLDLVSPTAYEKQRRTSTLSNGSAWSWFISAASWNNNNSKCNEKEDNAATVEDILELVIAENINNDQEWIPEWIPTEIEIKRQSHVSPLSFCP